MKLGMSMHDGDYSRVVGAPLTHVGDTTLERPSEREDCDIKAEGSSPRAMPRLADREEERGQVGGADFGAGHQSQMNATSWPGRPHEMAAVRPGGQA
jgi:hypothetical protein